MITKLFVAAAAASLLAAGAAQAATSRHAAGVYAEPSQPVAYSKLPAYLKASPQKRAKADWTNDNAMASANTGGAVNTSATQAAPAQAAPMDSTAPQSPPSAAAPQTAAPVNPPPEQMAPADQSAPSGAASTPPQSQ